MWYLFGVVLGGLGEFDVVVVGVVWVEVFVIDFVVIFRDRVKVVVVVEVIVVV